MNKLPEYKKVSVGSLIPFLRNSRTHSEGQVEQIVDSIREFGFTNPILIDSGNMIIAGHGRLLAAQKLGMKEVPCIVLNNLTDIQKRAYVIADNKLALNAGWDFDILLSEVQELTDAGFNIELTGFSLDEIADLQPDVLNEGLCDEDEVDEPPMEPIVKLGDVWLLGSHRLMCGDGTMINDVEKLMNGEKADMVFTDPPYGIDEETDRAFASRTRKCKGNTFDKIIGDDSIQTAVDSYNLCELLNIDVLVFWGANYYCNSLPLSGNWLVWDKREEDKQRDMNSDCELAWVKSKANSVRIFRHLWKGMIKGSENGQARVHPTQKPIALAEWAFDEYAPDSKTVLDLFGGSGSTLIACEKTGRKCFMMELSPNYCDVIIKRWQKFTGKQAILESNGKKFDEVSHDVAA